MSGPCKRTPRASMVSWLHLVVDYDASAGPVSTYRQMEGQKDMFSTHLHPAEAIFCYLYLMWALHLCILD
ncbi:hypothetical protein BDV26DRAFT_276069 [Aspergillus bertholletiae]|uniref:Uncharacterized protein n=1 Tax=Aspergillus bertholletiae TaxID=1226010 RepID=A0A5N7ARR0_9EURO|nr:hypothetical protein BDV26DRAFT_276069 [Aspergillus bertholletiae]